MKSRDYISDMELSRHETGTILDLAFELKRQYASGIPHELLKGKTFFMLFYNKSLRTRNSFEAGNYQLGGNGHYLTPEAVYKPAAVGDKEAFITERISDVARVLSRMGHGIGIRIFGDPVG